MIRQLSIFAENKRGAMNRITEVLDRCADQYEHTGDK
jgi:hypothetical protein